MEATDNKMNLYQKLAKIRALSDVAQKTKKGYGYTYTDITMILANVTAGMKKYGVSLIPMIVPQSARVRQNVVDNIKFNKQGEAVETRTTEMLFSADMIYRWINDDNPEEFIDVPWFVTGAQSDPAQALGTGVTYTMRQFLTAYFQIAQSDQDVDAYRSKQKEAEESEDKAIAAEIINTFDGVLKAYLADNPDDNEKVKKFIGKFAKNSNYFAIKDPNLAAKLLEDFNKTFITKE